MNYFKRKLFKLKWYLTPLRKKLLTKWLTFKYRHQDDSVCCCGADLPKANNQCSLGCCRSLKEYVITKEVHRRINNA